MKQISAVEWLYNEWAKNGTIFLEDLDQAKEMEKQRIMEAMDWIMNKYFEFHEQPTTSAREQYYNETFKSE
jgi:hypothetical protein